MSDDPAQVALLDVTTSCNEDGPRILTYSHDSVGLGHMRRNFNVVSQALDFSSGGSALMLVGSPAGFVFDLPDGIDAVKLPSLAKTSAGGFAPARLNVSGGRLRKMRAALFRQAVETFEPDVLLVDHVPAGVDGELIETLRWLRERPHRPTLFLGLRDILDAPHRTRANWRQDGSEDAIRDCYDAVLVYGEQQVFDTASVYGLNELARGRVRYCGYTAARPEPADADALRRRYGAEDRPLILFSGGGGRDAYPLLKAGLEGLERIAPAARPAALFVAGPLMRPDLREDLRAGAERLGCGFAERLRDFPSHLAIADRLVGMGGYNSVMEALSLGMPTLIVPREGPSAEQMMRAEVLSRRGLAETLTLAEATPDRLARMMRETGRLEGARRPLVEASGARRAGVRLASAATMLAGQRAA